MRILFVAYHFPPIGGGGVQRAAKFARYLPEHGIEPIVLTGPGPSGDHWAPDDPTMLDEVSGTTVIRVPGPLPPGATGIRRKLERLSGRRSEFHRWWIDAIVQHGMANGAGVDLILGELVPYETAFGVAELARRLDVPWVADLQDPWALDEMWLYPSFLHRLADRTRMRRTLAGAASVIMNTPEAAHRLRTAFPEFESRRVFSIPNGFDAEDFTAVDPAPDDGAFHIVHTGYLHTELGLQHRRTGRVRRLLGGMPVPRVDFLTRSHVYVMEAIADVLREDPSLDGSIVLDLAGETTPADLAAAAAYPFVRFHGYRSHAETVALLKSAQLLFLPMHDLPPGTRAGLVPGKTYEYVASGSAVLAAVPEGDARDLLVESGTATVCRPTDVKCMAEAIRARVAAWRRGLSQAPPDPDVLARYERRRLTADLASVLTGG
jgi:glycosyltransferase involved in cell wall biosynthesis